MAIKNSVQYHQKLEDLASHKREYANPSPETLESLKSPLIKEIWDEAIPALEKEIAEYVAGGGDTERMHVPLQVWFSRNMRQNPNLIYLAGMKQQVMFVRDNIVGLVGVGLPHNRVRFQLAYVISEHNSKSVALPVYSLERPDIGMSFVLRGNFYNWKLSVLSARPVECNFDGLFYTSPPVEPKYTGNCLSPVYFEGFPRDLIFGYYSEDKQRFSAEISGDQALWTTMFLIMRAMSQLKPMKWTTKEEHRAELAANKDDFEEYKRLRDEEDRLLGPELLADIEAGRT